MLLNASKSRSSAAFFVAVAGVTVAAALGPGFARAQAAAPVSPQAVLEAPQPVPAGWGFSPVSARLPNVVLKTHDGKNVRFYDDLVKGKVVIINFMYSTCKGR